MTVRDVPDIMGLRKMQVYNAHRPLSGGEFFHSSLLVAPFGVLRVAEDLQRAMEQPYNTQIRLTS